MIRRNPVLLVLFALALAACPMKSAIWIVPGSTRDHFEFGISDKRLGDRAIQWGGLAVSDCRTNANETTQKRYWVLERNPKFWNGNWPNRITYGDTPADFTTTLGPEPLKPGCYEASILGTGYVAFLIDSDGAVRELDADMLGPPPDTSRIRPTGSK